MINFLKVIGVILSTIILMIFMNESMQLTSENTKYNFLGWFGFVASIYGFYKLLKWVAAPLYTDIDRYED